MNRKRFSKEEQMILKANPYVESVTENCVMFTPEFKERAYQELLAGKRMKAIFEGCGVNTEVLGDSRINGFREKLYQYAEREEGFANLRKMRHRGAAKQLKAETTSGRLKYLENEVAYLQQQVEFLKKMRQADMEAQKQWESKHRRK